MLRHSLCHTKRSQFPTTPSFVPKLSQRVGHTERWRPCLRRAYSSNRKAKTEEAPLQEPVNPNEAQKDIWSRFASILTPVLIARADRPLPWQEADAPTTQSTGDAPCYIPHAKTAQSDPKVNTPSEEADAATTQSKSHPKLKPPSGRAKARKSVATKPKPPSSTKVKSPKKTSKASERKSAEEETAEKEPPKGRRRRRAPRAKPSSLATLTKFPSEDTASVVSADQLRINALDLDRNAVPKLEYGLDRVLFNTGIYQLQDARSRVYNFDPYLKNIMPLVEFDFDTIKEYKTSSRDTVLRALAETHRKKYVGSTSSMTSTLSHFHFLLSNWRGLDHDSLSRGFPSTANDFTKIAKAPNAIFLRYNPETKTYAIDADKEFDTPNVLMLLGKSMELLLTKSTAEFERHKKGHRRPISAEERSEPEVYQYTTMGDFLMRSQLDAHDPRLPGTGMFDLKTRAVLTVRMNSADYEPMTGYQLETLRGNLSSYEREMYDMTRSTMLKYLLQVRMGRMDGIFVAYHNVEQMFGFQYLPVSELDSVIHGQSDTTLGDAEFKFSLHLLNEALEQATTKFPEQSLRLHFETQADGQRPAYMVYFAEPVEEEEIERIQGLQKDKIAEFERRIMEGSETSGASNVSDTPQRAPAGASSDEPILDATTSTGAAWDTCSNVASSSGASMSADASILSDTAITTSSLPISDASNQSEASTSSGAPSSNASPSDASSTACSSDTPSDLHLSPLLMGTITVSNSTKHAKNREWKQCEANRPHKIHSGVNWRVEYLVREVDADRATMWGHYEAMKRKRKLVFMRNADEKEPEGKEKKEDNYIKFLRALSNRGGVLRKERETLDLGKEKSVVGWPRMEASITEERIQSVDDYLEWMFQPPQPPVPDESPVEQEDDGNENPDGPFDAYHASYQPREAEQPSPTMSESLGVIYESPRNSAPEKDDALNRDALALLEEAQTRQPIANVEAYMKLAKKPEKETAVKG